LKNLLIKDIINAALNTLTELLWSVWWWCWALTNTVMTGLLQGCWSAAHNSKVRCILLVLEMTSNRGLNIWNTQQRELVQCTVSC